MHHNTTHEFIVDFGSHNITNRSNNDANYVTHYHMVGTHGMLVFSFVMLAGDVDGWLDGWYQIGSVGI
jgi:hypothetical protein